MKFLKKTVYPIFSLLMFFALGLSASASFPDVGSSHENSDAISYVREQGIVNGYPDSTYKPDIMINRAEFTKIIIESAFDSSEIESCIEENIQGASSTVFFSDVAREAWFSKYVCVARVNDIVNGYPDGTFKPGNEINFGEAAKIVVIALGGDMVIDPIWYKPYAERLAEDNAIPLSVGGFGDSLTRGEMAEIIYRLLANVNYKLSWTYAEMENGTAAIGMKITGVSANRSLYFGYPIVNIATESFPIYLFDCFTDSCPAIPLWGEEWTLNTNNRLAFDPVRNKIVYPRAAGVFQLEALDNETGESELLGFEEDYAVSYLPAIFGDTLAAAVFKDGKEIIVKYDLSSGAIFEISPFKGHLSCSWPAVSSEEKVYGICRDDMTWRILDESGTEYYSVQKTKVEDGLKSLVLDINGNGYFVEDEGIHKIDLSSKNVSEIMVGSEYKVATITATPYAEYLAGKAYRGDNWKIFATNPGGSDFSVLIDFDSEPGIPTFGPYLVGSNERSKMQGEEGSGEILGCSDSEDPRYAISTFLDADSDEQRRACLTAEAKQNSTYVNYGKGIYDFIQIDEVDFAGVGLVGVDVWFWDFIDADPVGHLFHMKKVAGKWLIDAIEPSGVSFI